MAILEWVENLDSLPALLHCSHRKQGNSNNAVGLFQRGMMQVGGSEGSVLQLRKLDIKPCKACGICERDTRNFCIFDGKDFARDIFRYLLKTPFIFIASPIYFYHLPSRFKTLIDRSQLIWAMKQRGVPEVVNAPKRPAYVTLFAGREKGDKLFDGALLTLRYFLESFNFEIVDPLCFRGMERIASLERDLGAAGQIMKLGKRAWETYAASHPEAAAAAGGTGAAPEA